jgi:hypothetical protein
VQQHQRSEGVGDTVNAESDELGGSFSKGPTQIFGKDAAIGGKAAISLAEALARRLDNSPQAPCVRTTEQPPAMDLWNLIPKQSEHPIGYSALDGCTPIFVDWGGKHSDDDQTEGFYENGRIEVNPKSLMQKTEKYRAMVLGHEELHAVLDGLDPASLNQAILPPHVLDKGCTQLGELGYEGADVEAEILPRLLTHDRDGTGLPGVDEEDRVIGEVMRRLLARSQRDPELKRLHEQLQLSHALTHVLMSGKAGIEALICVPGIGPNSSGGNFGHRVTRR